MYHYTGFGLRIASDILFPEMLEDIFRAPDLVIENGKVPVGLENKADITDENSSANDSEFFWDILGVCKYYACNGNRIVFEPYQGIDGRTVRLYLLATVMTVILNQRDCIPLHAAAVQINGRLSLIAGDSGAGKSTTLSGLLKRDYRIFSDDVIVLDMHGDQKIGAFASYPMIKLWGDAMIALNDVRFKDRSFPVEQGMDKYGVFYHEQFDTGSYPIERAIILSIKESGPVETRVLENAEAFKALNNQVYRPNLLHSNHLRQLNFAMLSSLVRQIEVIQVMRPDACDPEHLAAVIEAFLKS